MRLAFVVGDVKKQRASFGTVYLARAGAARGHEVSFLSVDDFTLTSENQVHATTVRPRATESNEALCAALLEGGEEREEPLAGYDVVFLRYNPHREGTLVGNPAIDFGWRLRLGGVLVVNDPEGTQRAGARMYLSGLPTEIRPRTLITREPAKVKAFLKSLDAPAVLKPLAAHEDSKDNVFYVARGQVKNLNQIITVLRKSGYIVVQEYLPDAPQGEKRLLLLNGEPIRVGKRAAIYRRCEGQPSDARRRCDLGPEEQRIVDILRPKLVADGLYLVGVDLVGGRVLELHVFTPGGMDTNLELYEIDVADAVVRDLERRVAVRRAYRKSVERVA